MKKELEMGIRKKISKKIAERYQRARKKEKGVFAQTLDTTDVFTGWTETICVENKSQEKAFKGLNKLMKQFPFSDIRNRLEIMVESL